MSTLGNLKVTMRFFGEAAGKWFDFVFLFLDHFFMPKNGDIGLNIICIRSYENEITSFIYDFYLRKPNAAHHMIELKCFQRLLEAK